MPKHPLFDTSRPGTSIPTRTAAPKPGPGFPANSELKGRVRSDPPPRAARATQENRFNVDKHGRRPPMTPPRRVR